MRSLILFVIAVLSSSVWLGLLVATSFASVTVSAGLLAVLFVMGVSSNSRGAS
jgi:hypothetical protein